MAGQLKLENYEISRKALICLDLAVSVQPPPKRPILTFFLENCQNSAVKLSIEKPILLDFVNLSTIPCLRLTMKPCRKNFPALDFKKLF